MSVGGGSATVADDYVAVDPFDITIPAGTASRTGTFRLTPVTDEAGDSGDTIEITGTVPDDATITVTSARSVTNRHQHRDDPR